MIHKENRILFYFYFAVFLLTTYIGRNILSPNEHGFNIVWQVLSLCLLPLLYKNFMVQHKVLSGIAFFMYFVLVWEVINLIPPILGLLLSIFIYNTANVNLGLSWSFVVLKPLALIVFIWINRISFFSLFNSLVAEKSYFIDNLDTKTLYEKFNQQLADTDYANNTAINEDLDLNNMRFYAPQKSCFYLNQTTQIISLFFDKTLNSKFKNYLSLAHQEQHYFFFNNKKIALSSQIKIRNNVLLIINKQNNNFLLYDMEKFTPSLKEAIINLLKN